MWNYRWPAHVDSEGYLRCHHCGEHYLHQGNTTIFSRVEDADWTRVMQQNGDEMVTTDFPSIDVLNPSSRRHGMIIEFSCEYCHGDESLDSLRLAIYQHKGVTFIEWVEG